MRKTNAILARRWTYSSKSCKNVQDICTKKYCTMVALDIPTSNHNKFCRWKYLEILLSHIKWMRDYLATPQVNPGGSNMQHSLYSNLTIFEIFFSLCKTMHSTKNNRSSGFYINGVSLKDKKSNISIIVEFRYRECYTKW